MERPGSPRSGCSQLAKRSLFSSGADTGPKPVKPRAFSARMRGFPGICLRVKSDFYEEVTILALGNEDPVQPRRVGMKPQCSMVGTCSHPVLTGFAAHKFPRRDQLFSGSFPIGESPCDRLPEIRKRSRTATPIRPGHGKPDLPFHAAVLGPERRAATISHQGKYPSPGRDPCGGIAGPGHPALYGAYFPALRPLDGNPRLPFPRGREFYVRPAEKGPSPAASFKARR